MKKTYTAKLDKKESKPPQTAKKGSLEWYKQKYGALQGEEQYHLQKALEASQKINRQSKTITSKPINKTINCNTVSQPSVTKKVPKSKTTKKSCKRK